MRISDWSSDVCSSDLKAAGFACVLLAVGPAALAAGPTAEQRTPEERARIEAVIAPTTDFSRPEKFEPLPGGATTSQQAVNANAFSHSSANMSFKRELDFKIGNRSEEHTSELQLLMRSSYAVFCFKK